MVAGRPAAALASSHGLRWPISRRAASSSALALACVFWSDVLIEEVTASAALRGAAFTCATRSVSSAASAVHAVHRMRGGVCGHCAWLRP